MGLLTQARRPPYTVLILLVIQRFILQSLYFRLNSHFCAVSMVFEEIYFAKFYFKIFISAVNLDVNEDLGAYLCLALFQLAGIIRQYPNRQKYYGVPKFVFNFKFYEITLFIKINIFMIVYLATLYELNHYLNCLKFIIIPALEALTQISKQYHYYGSLFLLFNIKLSFMVLRNPTSHRIANFLLKIYRFFKTLISFNFSKKDSFCTWTFRKSSFLCSVRLLDPICS